MKRTKLCDRILPTYSRGEEQMNTITHIVGGGLALVGMMLCLVVSALHHNYSGLVGSAVYGICMVALYSVSSVYHGLRPGLGKKVMQIIDHCTIYFLIGGTYTVLLLSSIIPAFPFIGWGLLIFEWTMVALAATLTAIDLKKYNVFSMICYIGMGWAVIPFASQVRQVLGPIGFSLLLWGGIAYTIGAVLYGIGSRKKWMHSVFHLFVILGSLLQFLSILLYSL